MCDRLRPGHRPTCSSGQDDDLAAGNDLTASLFTPAQAVSSAPPPEGRAWTSACPAGRPSNRTASPSPRAAPRTSSFETGGSPPRVFRPRRRSWPSADRAWAQLPAILLAAASLAAHDHSAARAHVVKPPDDSAARGALTASPQRGPAPLSVSFTGSAGGASYFGGVWLEFDDGNNIQLCLPGLGCQETTVSHTYTNPGAYTVRLVGIGEGTSRTLGTTTINVSRGRQGHD